MIETAPILTERLILRGWRESDVEPFHAMGNDAEVMAYLGPHLSRADAEAAAERQNDNLAALGYCFWAVERREDGAFIGFCGVKPGPSGTPIEGEIEIGWRLARPCWGKGYAREAAQASLDWVWANLPVASVSSITVPGNIRSWGLMERLGFVRAMEDDFDHPNVPVGNPIRRHITYRIARPDMVNRR